MADDKAKTDDNDKNDDVVADIGGIFGVATSGKKKKKKKKKEVIEEPVESEEVELSADDSVPFPAEDADKPEVDENAKTTVRDQEPAVAKSVEKPKKKKKNVDGVAGILTPGVEDPALAEYLNDDDLGEFDAPKNKTVPILIGLIVFLVIGLVGMAIVMTDSGGDLVALAKGELKEKRIEEAKMIKEKFDADQRAKLDKFGSLVITGNPQYADITLNGETHYGQTSSGAWRKVRIGAIAGLKNLKVKQDQELVVSAPGYETTTLQLKEAMWQPGQGGEFVYAYTASLAPKSVETKQEFDARLGEDAENEFYGTVTVNSTPPGATIKINNHVLTDEKGTELKTPATFDKFFVKDEKTGKTEEQQVRVDATIGIGNKLEIELPFENKCEEGKTYEAGKDDGCCPPDASVATDNDCKHPRVVEALQREMWICNWKDGEFPKEIAKKKTVQHYCDYTYKQDVDFGTLKSYIIRRHEEQERIKKQIEEVKKAAKAAKDK